MRLIDAGAVADTVRELYIRANRALPPEIEQALADGARREGRDAEILGILAENCRVARQNGMPVCQDTGMVIVFADLGCDAHIDGNLEKAVNEGVSRGCREGLLRASVVADPLRRQNTGDDTPAVLHIRLCDGDRLKLTVCPKGFGSENMSRLQMFTPSLGEDELVDYVVQTARLAGANACPPMVIGVGLGGDFETAPLLAKRALCRRLGSANPDPLYAALEEKMRDAVNALPIGPQGFGGFPTALGVQAEFAPTHIAGFPVAVNIGCHVTRHAEAVL